MDKMDKLIEKCRLTEEELRQARDRAHDKYNDELLAYLEMKRHSSPNIVGFYTKEVAETQLRKAISIIQKAERERIRQILGIPPSSEPYCLDCACLPDVDNCRLYGITLKWDESRQGHLRCEQCRKEW
ncbi:MAG: hypothetical protein DRI01_08515 [Chloroflexi bacterium]|nr:MAG: hypothetical protein DRI01_08515 [Chloroflexota bacterium]